MESRPVLRPYQIEMITKLTAETKSRVMVVIPTGVGKEGALDRLVDAPRLRELRARKSGP
jgi:ERCC4-related helicase